MFSVLDILNQITEFKPAIKNAFNEISELDISCKSVLKCYIDDSESIGTSSVLKIQAVIDYMYEQVNIGNWKEVRLYLRKTITLATYLKLIAHIKTSDEITDSVLKECYKIIDFGILFGCPLDIEPRLLQNCAAILNTLNFKTEMLSNDTSCSTSGESASSKSNEHNATPIEVADCPSMEQFYKDYILSEKPVVVTNSISHWPALNKWVDQNYFIKLAGMRTVSVELGRDYTDLEWTQKLMTIEEFIKNHIYQTNGATGYLAQYQLFEQIPELKNDIAEPEYCCFSDSNEPVDIMAWYGPKGTISPIHHDPKRNLLAQVVGQKEIFLFSPKDSEYLYPHEHELLNNTARIDPRNPDLIKYPKYSNATPYYCVLKPGQMLYIPPKWWHFVESLSVSFSVSFWWD